MRKRHGRGELVERLGRPGSCVARAADLLVETPRFGAMNVNSAMGSCFRRRRNMAVGHRALIAPNIQLAALEAIHPVPDPQPVFVKPWPS